MVVLFRDGRAMFENGFGSGMADHHVKLDWLGTAGKLDFLDCLEPVFGVDFWIDVVAAFEIAFLTLCVGLCFQC